MCPQIQWMQTMQNFWLTLKSPQPSHPNCHNPKHHTPNIPFPNITPHHHIKIEIFKYFHINRVDLVLCKHHTQSGPHTPACYPVYLSSRCVEAVGVAVAVFPSRLEMQGGGIVRGLKRLDFSATPTLERHEGSNHAHLITLLPSVLRE